MVELQDIIDRITIPGSILKETECRAVIHEFFQIISENLREGIGLKSEYINIQPGLGGIFDGYDDTFDPKRHKKLVHLSAGRTLKNAVSKMKLTKKGATSVRPQPRTAFDFRSTISNKILTPGNGLIVEGSLLKYDANTIDEGVFYIHAETNMEWRSDTVINNFPSKLGVIIPDALQRGSYYIEVRSRIGNSRTLTKGRLEHMLKVM
jgi:hypothetical protein